MFKQTIFTFVLGFFCAYCSAQAPTIDSFCEVYGSIQGAYYDGFLKMCSESSSSEACDEVLQKLSSEFNMATDSRKSYAEANVQGCKIVLKTIDDGIYFAIEGSVSLVKQLKNHLKSYCKTDDCF